jgi:hypothetical protein
LFEFVVRICGYVLIAPEPAHHAREDCAAVLLAVVADSPGVIDLVAFGFESIL